MARRLSFSRERLPRVFCRPLPAAGGRAPKFPSHQILVRGPDGAGRGPPTRPGAVPPIPNIQLSRAPRWFPAPGPRGAHPFGFQAATLFLGTATEFPVFPGCPGLYRSDWVFKKWPNYNLYRLENYRMNSSSGREKRLARMLAWRLFRRRFPARISDTTPWLPNSERST